MDLATLITTDHTIFDGVQTITLKNPAGTSSDSVAYVTAGPVAFKALQLIGGGLVDNSQLLAFSLPASLCSFAPIDSATITDADGVVWRVLSVDKKTFDNRYVCNCVRDKGELSAPLQPTNVTLTPYAGQIDVSWRQTESTGYYYVEVSTSSTFASTETSQYGLMAGPYNSSTSTATLAVTGLTAGVKYVRVRRENALGISPYSDVQSTTVT